VGRLIQRGANTDPIASQFHSPMPFHVVFDYSYDGVMRSVEGSYQRLGLDRIDILLLHDLGEAEHGKELPRIFKGAMEGGYRALEELKRAGQIRAIGMGVNEVGICEEAMRHGDFDCFLLAGRYTLLEQGGQEELFPACRRKGVSIILGGPFNSGILVRAARPMRPTTMPRCRRRSAPGSKSCSRSAAPMASRCRPRPCSFPWPIPWWPA
jgi:Predicted oxidoreductases (related to aryl-alcohol dehydrogenases)